MGSNTSERVREIRIIPIAVRGEIRAGESLSASLLAAARSLGLRFQEGDILVVKHKIVSKAEGALVALDESAHRLRREPGLGATGSMPASVNWRCARAGESCGVSATC
jgi:hypothetical protein